MTSWRTVPLGSILEHTIGGVWGDPQGSGEVDVSVLRVTELKKHGALEPRTAAQRSVSMKQLAGRQLQPGDLLLEKSGGGPTTPVGRVGLVRVLEGQSICSNFMQLMRPAPERVVPRYLHLYLNFLHDRGATIEMQTASTNIRNIKASDYLRLEVALPSLEEQRRIVDLLEDHLSRLDAAEGYLRRVVMKEDLARGAVFQAALLSAEGTDSGDVETLTTDRARRCPPNMKRGRPHATAAADVAVPWEGHWPTVSLEAATDPVRTISYGILKPGPNIESGIPYVRVLNMRRDVLALDDLHRTSPIIAAQYARATLEPDDVLVSIRGTYGRIVLVPDVLRGANITQDTARLAVLPQFSPEFISLVLRSPWAQQHLKRIARGVGVKGVNITDLREVPIPLPSLDVQRRLVVHSQELTSDLEAANRAAHAGLRRASSLRRSLLVAAFSGQLANASAVSEGLDV